MMNLVREFRLIPVVLIAIASLFALKTLGLVLDGGYTFGVFDNEDAAPAPTITAKLEPSSTRLESPEIQLPTNAPAGKQSWAQEMFNFPDVTGSIDPPKPAEPAKPGEAAKREGAEAGKPPPPINPKRGPAGTVIPLDPNRPASEAERAILERLKQRREELDARARELDIRESLLKAAEKRVEARVGELKDVENRINAAMRQKDEIEAGRFKGLVTMYETMKPKDAAKIFERLELKVLVELSTQINPRRMAEILAQMGPEAAERLTLELASRASLNKGPTQQQPPEPPSPNELPKIEGRRSGS